MTDKKPVYKYTDGIKKVLFNRNWDILKVKYRNPKLKNKNQSELKTILYLEVDDYTRKLKEEKHSHQNKHIEYRLKS